ncbi:MAG: hypothetical protein A2654_00345 [Candidatus Nealsonbacteria bacterium RIFCSPHIGHO2_01_FULL_43_31]|uniref:Transcriptional repressor PaaX-like central Cas2-like domain-containing protein n=2 Tax=Candidatus Nealsoniibacteriota TaxID=1817911 RepID=A0A1G2E8A3_9BACT|nr:MAG: hypothetical protein UV98_C0023G0007 [Parcubacteria group bacterium GW2011_GWB1_43_6]OGZ20609.1 MAG: hypothetical protein A2654_00345 [Candidatus Nealsonbacteria bacterium RIFCSPHIGHO2_01_FULL_43_31]OGZ21511.1 MAG: hypothetical protein A3D46_00080 [Candidatus Nealsonbacteria bacterium RIFCSPHIGHO2_02_FULL_43_13]OGZ25488.1 MAG: hypothetical protein A2922_01565 [Candidatus Nealsonbacteria bacterium RIFCSPLOWO2_01_FULL_43_36]
MEKYKYYFRKPRSEITKDILTLLLISGGIAIAATSPYFGIAIWKNLKNRNKYPKRRVSSKFCELRKRGFIILEKDAHDIKLALTPKGEKIAGYMQINKMKIQRPKKWDSLWRVLTFDISNLKTTQRNAIRKLLKEIGFQCLQKSVWVHAFDCKAEIEIINDFFGLKENEMRLIVAKDIGDSRELKRKFRLS